MIELFDFLKRTSPAARARVSRWAKRNREKINARIRQDYAVNPEKYKARCKRFYERRRDALIHTL